MRQPKWFKDMKLRNKLIFNYFCFGLIPLLLIGTVVMIQVQEILYRQEAVRNEDYLKQAISSLDGQIKVYNNLSDYISFSSTVERICNDSYNSNYEKYLDYSDGFNSLVGSMKYFHKEIQRITLYVDSNEAEFENSIMPVSEIKNKSWFSKIKNDRLPHWIFLPNQKKVFSARRIPSLEQEEKVNIIYIEVDYHKLFEQFQNMTNTDYGIYMLDQNGRIIYDIQQFSKDKEWQQISLEQVMEEEKKQEDYIVTKKKATENDWTAYLYRSSQSIQMEIERIMKDVIIGVILCICLSFLCIRIITNRTIKGIEQLKSNMESVEQGTLEMTVHSDSQDEIGELIRGFNKMLIRIKQLIEEVYESKIKQKEYEMRALQAQINPHFLYNSLSLINWIALEQNSEEISKITLAMSSFYRTALNKGNNILSLKDEIENMKSYLQIQLIMHDYEFDTEIQVEEGLEDYIVLNLILQPMVENAIDHGIDLKTDGRGKLIVTAKSDGDDILIVVEDNGIGMEQKIIDTILTQQSKGYGLRNVNERIKLYYGQQYHLTIESQLGVGTKIITRIPKQKKEE